MTALTHFDMLASFVQKKLKLESLPDKHFSSLNDAMNKFIDYIDEQKLVDQQ